jgi:ubiquinone/menaquinone biosynthesis C-methylase UbiE
MNYRVGKGFDRIARVYDFLARLVFGKAIIHSQIYFFDELNSCRQILILGGGTGWILKHLNNVSAKIDYVDESPAMVSIAKKKYADNQNINFIVGTIDNILINKYDGVITNFFLDLFDDATLLLNVNKINRVLIPGAKWIVTDFVSNKLWQRLMLWLMYRFFNLITGIKTKLLPNWERFMNKTCKPKKCKFYYFNFIKANLYILE